MHILMYSTERTMHPPPYKYDKNIAKSDGWAEFDDFSGRPRRNWGNSQPNWLARPFQSAHVGLYQHTDGTEVGSL